MTAEEASPSSREALDLLDWRRRIADVYAAIRSSPDPRTAWSRWREVRADLILRHPQSPIEEPDREGHPGPAYFDYQPAMRVLADVEAAEPEHVEIEASAGGRYGFTRVGRARFTIGEGEHTLSVFWMDGYAGGMFLSFRDATSGSETYGAGRYLLDTAKGADLGGTEDGRLVLDFNFAFNPSCAYHPRWVCPLAPRENRLPVPIRAGEKVPAGH
jgi:uncharacterized protein (DUF1684 family)